MWGRGDCARGFVSISREESGGRGWRSWREPWGGVGVGKEDGVGGG